MHYLNKNYKNNNKLLGYIARLYLSDNKSYIKAIHKCTQKKCIMYIGIRKNTTAFIRRSRQVTISNRGPP